MRLPSTPAWFASVCSFSVPFGWAALDRKSWQPYIATVARISDTVPKSSGCLDAVFIVTLSYEKDGLLEGCDQAKAERAIAGIRTAVDATILIANVARGSRDLRRRERRIEAVV